MALWMRFTSSLRPTSMGSWMLLSGAALTEMSTRMVARIHDHTGGGIPIIGVGGIMGPADARAKLDAGATLVQVYTGLVYEGPGLVRQILTGL